MVTAAAVGVALVASACSSSGGSSGTGTSTSPASSAGSGSGVAAAAAELAKHTGIPAFTPPGPSIDVSSLKGKTVYSIIQSSANPFLAVTESAQKALADKLGIKYVEYTTQGTPAEWMRGINQAIAVKASAILLDALDPRLVAPQIAAAKAAGIPVVSAQFYDLSQVSSAPTDLAAVRADNFTEAAKLEADEAIKDTDGKADVVVVENKEQLSTLAMLASLKAEFAANCPACKVTYINVPSSEWATKIQTEVQSAIVSDPGINYIIPIYDPMSQFVIPAITATSKTNKIHIATFNGIPAVLSLVKSGPDVKMDVGENMQWLAYANLDELFRVMLGKPPVADEKTALRVFTSSNIADTGNPPEFSKGTGNAYITGYDSLLAPTGPWTTSRSACAPARSMACWARTARGSPRSSRSCRAITARTRVG
jgi:ribose transport system substrate-binding protein